MLRETKVGHSLSSKEGSHHSLQNPEGLLRVTGRLCPIPQREIKMALEDITYAGFKCALQSPVLETELERRGVRGPANDGI